MDFLRRYIAELPHVAATLTATFVIFACSLAFSPVRNWLFPADISTYPLMCTAEPIPAGDGRMTVEFFIVNREGKAYSAGDLDDVLRTHLTDPTSNPSTDIHLNMTRRGTILSATADRAFNQDKGALRVASDQTGVTIKIDNIEARAILRTTIEIDGLASVDPKMSRNAKDLVPLDVTSYQDACYRR